MTEATITIEDAQSVSPDKTMKVVHISGQLDESNIDEKIQEVYKVLEANPKNLNLVFELEHLEYMNSKSIGYVTDIYGKVTESLGQVAIAQARPNITDILQVVGLSQLIKMFPSVDEAKGYLENSSASTTLASDDEAPAPAEPAPVETPVEPTETPVAPVETPATPETPAEPVVPTEMTPEAPEPVIEEAPVEATPAPAPEPATLEPEAPMAAPAPAEPAPVETPAAPTETPVAPVETPATPETPAEPAAPAATPDQGGTFNIG